MQRRTVIGDGLLFDPLDLSGSECSFKLLPKPALRIFCQDIKNVPADRLVTRNTLYANFAMSIPRDDLVIAIDHIKRDGQCIKYGFSKLSMLFASLSDRIVESQLVVGG